MGKFTTVCILASLCFYTASAQQTFNKIVSGNYKENLNDLVATKDGGYVLTGETRSSAAAYSKTFVTKLDINGDFVWGRIFGTAEQDIPGSIVTTSDGGYAIAGCGTGAMTLLKLDAGGSFQWSKSYNSEEVSGAHALIQTLDGGYALGGYMQTKDRTIAGYLVKTDAAGKTQWSRRIMGFGTAPAIQSLVQTKDGGYVCVLNGKNKNDYSDVYVVKIDKNGNSVWSRSVGGESTDFPHAVITTKDEGFAILGTSHSFNNLNNADMYLVKIDKDADLLWSRVIGDTSGSESGYDLLELADGSLIAAGRSSTLGVGYDDVYMAKVDAVGNLIYTKTLGTEKADIASAIALKTDGSFVVGGYADFYSGTASYEMMLLKFDINSGICSSTGSGGSSSSAKSPFLVQSTKVTDATTKTGTGPVYIGAAGFVNTICSETLPVRLTSFTAIKLDNGNQLSWTATEETNTASYGIERSTDGIHFNSIGTVMAANNGAIQNRYGFTDATPVHAVNYYRLRITSIDGHIQYSDVVQVNNSGKLTIRLFTNPVRTNIPLEFNTEKDEVVQLTITGTDGRVYYHSKLAVQAGVAIYNIPASALAAGLYFIKVNTATGPTNIRFIKQ